MTLIKRDIISPSFWICLIPNCVRRTGHVIQAFFAWNSAWLTSSRLPVNTHTNTHTGTPSRTPQWTCWPGGWRCASAWRQSRRWRRKTRRRVLCCSTTKFPSLQGNVLFTPDTGIRFHTKTASKGQFCC